jgi:uncharacterized phage protein (TIGR02218 family)
MTYATLETSPYGSEIFELYAFQTADQAWYFTSSDHPITYLGQTYQPEVIKRTQTNQTAEAKGGTVRVTLPKENPVPQQFVSFSPDSPMFLVIYRGHGGDSEIVVNFTGKVTMSSFGDFAELNCIPESDVLKNSVPGMQFQSACNHFLYDSGCTINKTLFKVFGTIATIDATGMLITVAAAASKVDGWFTAGYVEMGEQRRMILLHAGNALTLLAPLFGGVEVGDEITLYAGCMRDYNTCVNKFSNGKNYVGFQWIPEKNPFKDPFY